MTTYTLTESERIYLMEKSTDIRTLTVLESLQPNTHEPIMAMTPEDQDRLASEQDQYPALQPAGPLELTTDEIDALWKDEPFLSIPQIVVRRKHVRQALAAANAKRKPT